MAHRNPMSRPVSIPASVPPATRDALYALKSVATSVERLEARCADVVAQRMKFTEAKRRKEIEQAMAVAIHDIFERLDNLVDLLDKAEENRWKIV